VSTALRSLADVGLVERVPAPGSRREHYRCPDDAWARLMSAQNTTVQAMLRAAERGISAVGENTVAGRRLTIMHDFYTHLMSELPAVIDRWRQNQNGTEQ
jgi:DNA-binding transcriptional regulator GbsR (MarR family)